MRRMIVMLLLASVSAPVLAGPDDQENRRAVRAEARAAVRAQQAENRPARVDRVERLEQSQHIPRLERAQSVREQIGSWSRRERADEARRVEQSPEQSEQPRVRRVIGHHRPEASEPIDREERTRVLRPRVRESDRLAAPGSSSKDLAQQPRSDDATDRRLRRVLDRRLGDREGRMSERDAQHGGWNRDVREPLAVSTVPRAGTQPPLRPGRVRRNWSSEWSRDWRDDRRYDWRHHRNRNRSLFHIGFYYDPFGWNYRRYDIGWRMWPSYYSRSHWLHDPWMYRLPPAYPGTRWIRYHGDAILIDTWTGEVVDVIHDFFW